jgi:hypothetical protein
MRGGILSDGTNRVVGSVVERVRRLRRWLYNVGDYRIVGQQVVQQDRVGFLLIVASR